jgi:probable phosphoglycerate mutase
MIYLIRHGQTEFNRERRYQGGSDSPLTELGRRQARAVGLRLGELGVAGFRLVSSPLGRTVQTAEIVREAAAVAAPIELEPRIAEVSMGVWETKTREEIEATSPGFLEMAAAHRDWYFRAPQGERYDDMAQRLGDWLRETLADGRPVVAISHGIAGLMLRGLYMGWDKARTLDQTTPQDAFFRLADGTLQRFDLALAA